VANHIAYIVRQAKDRNLDRLEVTPEAETNWVDFHVERSKRLHKIWRDCTPSYFNHEGSPSASIARDGAFGGTVMEFIDILQQWRAKGDMAGLQLTRQYVETA
jgi:cyclohexanone monooxygenase